jgi:nucleoside-diphosphate-sugar epimerase
VSGVLIIGGGLVGSQLARLLVAAGERPAIMDRALQPEALAEIVDLARVRLVEGDVLRPLSLAQAIRECGITEIVHTAANPLLTLGAQRDPYGAIELNVMGTVNVLEAVRVHELKRVVVASSNVLNHFLAGGEGNGDPAREEAFMRPTTFYATTKQAIENLGLNYARWCGVDFAAVRYGAVAGPWRGRGGGGPSNLLREAVERALRGEEAVVPAAGLEWVYAKDAARGTMLALRAPRLASRVFNITMGYVCKPDELAAALKAAVPGTRVRIETPAASAAAMPSMQHASDLSLAKEVLGFTPEYRMADAVRELAEWHAGRARADAEDRRANA